MADELLDLIDRNDNVIGAVLKSEAHNNRKLIHREVAIIVFDTKHRVLLQQRSLNKSILPGAWKITAAGHPNSGEDPMLAIERELFEELGIGANPVFYKKVFSSLNIEGQSSESRITWVYYAVLNELPKIILQESEVGDAQWVQIKDLQAFSLDHDYNFNSDFNKILLEIATKLKLI